MGAMIPAPQTIEYSQFLNSKVLYAKPVGIDISEEALNKALYDAQAASSKWAISRGRAALFLDTGFGKTRIILEFAHHLAVKQGKRALIVCPLSVIDEFIKESGELGYQVNEALSMDDIHDSGIWVTNYEKIHKFDARAFNTVALDESSILKSLDSKTRLGLTAQWRNTPYKLCATATPAPNDTKELVNHADFLGVMSRKEVFATFFINESKGKGRKKKLVTRLKHNAVDAFYRWLSSWAIAARTPSDLGFSDAGHELPPLNLHTWHHLNNEGYMLRKALGDDAVLIEGKMSPESKSEAFRRFKAGEVRVLITKPRIGGFGVNLQQSFNQIWCGITDSFEQFYQAVRRQWRRGQCNPVNVHVILADVQQAVWENIQRKQGEHEGMIQQLVERLNSRYVLDRQRDDYHTDIQEGQFWKLFMGDSCDPLGPVSQIEDNTIGCSVHSPPFVNRYAYTATERDLGNSKNLKEFMVHYRYQIRELLRITMPGRSACVHVQNVRTTKRDTETHPGLVDFRGAVIQAFVKEGWVFVHEITVDKDAQIQAKRKHHQGLLYKTKNTDSSKLAGALADYLLVFRKPGDNPDPIDDSDVPDEDWNIWARPVWYHINEIDVLDSQVAKAADDEMHLAPLQKEFIRRCLRLWSKKGDLIFDPFNGIGSTGVVAIEQGRRYVGIELKPSYYQTAIKNLQEAERKAQQVDLWKYAGIDWDELEKAHAKVGPYLEYVWDDSEETVNQPVPGDEL
jgi:DNA modification methylase